MFARSLSPSLFASVAYFCVSFINLTSGQSSYCDICRDHTLCLYTRDGPSQQCIQYNNSGLLTDQQITAIVNEHNRLRKKVAEGQEMSGNPGPQPPASNMKMMKWDSELAMIAQRWAYQCIFGHDACRNSARFNVGQNTYMSCSASETIESIPQAWYRGVQQFDKNNVPRYRYSQSSEEYTQIVWANTSFIGCGAVRYVNTNNWSCFILICNYGPGGNIIGQPIYTIGQAGSNCPSGVSTETSSLCN